MIKAEDRAYCAGLFEGEGCLTSSITQKLSSGRRARRSLNLVIQMTDLEPLELFCDIMGVGNVLGPYHRGGTLKPYYSYQVSGYERIQFIICNIWMWLSPRRKKQIETSFIIFKSFKITQSQHQNKTWRSVK